MVPHSKFKGSFSKLFPRDVLKHKGMVPFRVAVPFHYLGFLFILCGFFGEEVSESKHMVWCMKDQSCATEIAVSLAFHDLYVSLLSIYLLMRGYIKLGNSVLKKKMVTMF